MRERDERRRRIRPEKAGCVPVRRGANNAWEVLLVQARFTADVWAFPKGGVEDGEQPIQAAIRETQEEGGVTGDPAAQLGLWSFERNGRHRQRMWLMLVREVFGRDDRRWSERLSRTRAWYSLDVARQILCSEGNVLWRPELVQMLDAAQVAVCALVDGSTPNIAVATAAAASPPLVAPRPLGGAQPAAKPAVHGGKAAGVADEEST